MAIEVRGKTVDFQTRCEHYSGPTDIIAIKFKCCLQYYPCYRCHQEVCDHPVERWPASLWRTRAVLCGVCRTEHTITDYLAAGSCSACGSGFNPGCKLHHRLYFEQSAADPSSRRV